MSLFSRSSSRGHSPADSTLGDASPSARDMVERTRGARSLWRRLVAEVGPEVALEHLEVSYLTAMIDTADSVVSEFMQEWHFGVIGDETVLQRLQVVECDLAPRIEAAVGQVTRSSTRRESLEVAAVGRDFHTTLWKVSRGLVLGSLSEPEMHESVGVKQAWTEVGDAWDAATGRAGLPLVG